LKFVVKLPDGDSLVRTDRRALSQILLNLTNNAIKFTEAGGEVTVELRRRAENGSLKTEFAVADTGVGIKPEDQARLFQAFTQVGGPAGRHEGTGLGLHLSKKLAELLDGRITFKSDYGRGSEFMFTLDEKLLAS
jgi:protein-histidine pros-kinase